MASWTSIRENGEVDSVAGDAAQSLDPALQSAEAVKDIGNESFAEEENTSVVLVSEDEEEEEAVEESGESSEDEEDDSPEQLRDPLHVASISYLPRDIEAFLLNYPNPERIPEPPHPYNLQFYRNEIAFRPRGCSIDDFHRLVFGKHKFLERSHSYIQWLFPTREQGLNHHAYPIQPYEIQEIRDDEDCQKRLLVSFRIMLDFYGMDLDDENPLIITRHPDLRISRERYMHLMSSYHNYLRITRILKCLSELGQQDYVASFLLFILAEQSEYDTLNSHGIVSSMDRYWVYCMRERDAQHCVVKAARWVREGGQFTMDVYRQVVERKQSVGIWHFDPEEEGLEKNDDRRRRSETGHMRIRAVRDVSFYS
jgi:hypothetical protein